jgi:hypothetical protein
MARPTVVADASALICLGRVDQLQILPALFGRIVVPPAVAAEVTHRQPTLPVWIDVREPRRPLDHSVVTAHLGAGETEVLSLGLELDGAWLVLDDAQSRALGVSSGPYPTTKGSVIVSDAPKRLLDLRHRHRAHDLLHRPGIPGSR